MSMTNWHVNICLGNMEPMRSDVRQDDVADGVFILILQHESVRAYTGPR